MNDDNLSIEVIGLNKYLNDRAEAGLVSEQTMLQILYHMTAKKAVNLGQSWDTTRRDYKLVNDLLRERMEAME